MKPVFATDLTENKHNTEPNGREFLTQEPSDALRGIRKVSKRIRIEGWNKEEPCNQGRYKAYKLSEGDNGLIYCKPYYILELDRAGERWGIYFPCYELPAFERATGLTAEE